MGQAMGEFGNMLFENEDQEDQVEQKKQAKD